MSTAFTAELRSAFEHSYMSDDGIFAAKPSKRANEDQRKAVQLMRSQETIFFSHFSRIVN